MKPLIPAALTLFASPVLAQQVWVVDALNLPGTDFTDLQPAVDAASEGDVILVKGRLGQRYGTTVIDRKSLTIAGELDDLSPALVLVPPLLDPIEIRNLDPGQRVTLRGLHVNGGLTAAAGFLPSLRVFDSAGIAFGEELQLDRAPAAVFGSPTPAALGVDQSRSVTLVRSFVRGSDAFSVALGGPAAETFASSVALHGVHVEGGTGAPAPNPGAIPVLGGTLGGDGLRVFGSDVYAASSRILGGRGGRGAEDALMNCFPGGDGGTGAIVQSTALFNAELTTADTIIRGGPGGETGSVNCPAGADGLDVRLLGSLVDLPPFAFELGTTSPVREGETARLEFRGRPFDLVILLRGTFGVPLLDPAFFDGLLHTLPIASATPMGFLPVGGVLVRELNVSELGPGVEAVGLDLQAIFIDLASSLPPRPAGSNPSSVLLLDDSF